MTKTTDKKTETPAEKPATKPKASATKIEVKQIAWFDDRFYKIRYENDKKVEVEDYIPSITTKIGALAKPNLMRWYGDLGTREARLQMTEKGDRGSRIHWAWETFCGGGVVIYQPDKAPLYDKEEFDALVKRHNNHFFVLKNQDEMWNFMKLSAFHKAIKPYYMVNERVVYNIDLREAGTLDNLIGIPEGEYMISGAKPVKLERGLYLFDAKTGNYVGNEARFQLSAYFYCVLYMIFNGLIEVPEDYEQFGIKGAIIGHTSATTKNGIEGFSATILTRDQLHEYYTRYRNIAAVWEAEFGTLKPKLRQIPGYVAL
jgi:hypothetical protein